MTVGKQDFLSRAQLLLARLDSIDALRDLAPLLRSLRAEHEAVVGLGASVVCADVNLRRAREAARAAGGEVDRSVAKLADALVVAGVGDRLSPFASIGAPSPTAFVRVAGLRKAEATRGLLALVARVGGHGVVKRAAEDCEVATRAFVAALHERDHAEQTWRRALATRDARYASLRAGLRKLERRAEVAWEDQPDTARSLFAVLHPPRRRRPAEGADGAARTSDVAPAGHASDPSAPSGVPAPRQLGGTEPSARGARRSAASSATAPVPASTPATPPSPSFTALRSPSSSSRSRARRRRAARRPRRRTSWSCSAPTCRCGRT